jgi:hypothetical protein
LGLYVQRCARKLGGKNNPAATPGEGLLQHEFLNVSGKIISFSTKGNRFWSQGNVNDQEFVNDKCTMICNDPKFDSYVQAASTTIGAPTYCTTAFLGRVEHSLGARNCQSWIDDVLDLAKKNYLEKESCPTCFK